MKLFKKIVILSAVVLSLGSSVAFGDCPQNKNFSSGGPDTVKKDDTADTSKDAKDEKTKTAGTGN